MSQELTVDVDLENYLFGVPLITDEELEKSLLKSAGPIDPITVWKGKNIIVDGHRRYRICQRHDLPFTVREMEFLSVEDVKAYMDEWQVVRRNLSDAQYAITLARHAKRGKDTVTEADFIATGKAFGVPSRTVRRAVDYAEALESLPKDIRDVIASGRLKGGKDGKHGVTRAEVIALAELAEEIHQRRVIREWQSEAVDTLWEAIHGVGAPKAHADKAASGPPPGPPPERRKANTATKRREPAEEPDEMLDTVSSDADEQEILRVFFENAIKHVGLAKALVCRHEGYGVGIAKRITSLLERAEDELVVWRDEDKNDD